MNHLVFHVAVKVHRKPNIFVRKSADFHRDKYFRELFDFQCGAIEPKRTENEDGVHFGYVCNLAKIKSGFLALKTARFGQQNIVENALRNIVDN